MKLKLEQDLSCNDIEIAIKYGKKNRLLNRIIAFLQSADMQLKCKSDTGERMINVSDIYYIESIDKKTFLYLSEEVYYTESRLYQLIDELKAYGFVQISKSCILNINALENIKPLLNSRMEAFVHKLTGIAILFMAAKIYGFTTTELEFGKSHVISDLLK